ncbi:hypothetical protein J4573_12755 [Actinomadura barringtoniae]|uniref:Ig-like domain-containing protein n=1 Tax=Actinomadura barringtoniae TaxID=1427535 RepID=A0A939T1P1_9ACTN|nr:hypothetical protein [Actinomadura barringtoniae]MBO2447966.1 hypothetical protein [Actinomadura barringtoniae]
MLKTLSLMTAAITALSPTAQDPTWTVSPGGSFTAAASVDIKNVTRGWTISCQSMDVTGSAESGANQQGQWLLTFPTVTFTGCTGPGGTYTVTPASDFQWVFNAEGYDAGTTNGALTYVQLTAEASNGCKTDITAPDGGPGTAAARHANSDGSLSVNGDTLQATFTNFACSADTIATGDKFSFSTSLPITPRQTITSP